ncbi:MAG: phage tail protein [Proteobacteria bacterium]|nr:MAG: phage tail protein [Pseudomonadota bacterium]
MHRRAALVACTLALAALLRAGAARAEPHIGELRLLPYGYCPNGWLEANGALLAISEHEALFTLYGTTFGGDGETSFALPDLRGRVPLARGTGGGLTPRALGDSGGDEEVTLALAQLPAHAHAAGASGESPNATSPAGTLAARKSRTPNYRITLDPPAVTPRAADAAGPAGGGAPAPNLPPYTVLRWCVSLFGIYPQSP